MTRIRQHNSTLSVDPAKQLKRSGPIQRTKAMPKPKKRINPRNRKRAATVFERCFHSVDFVKLVKQEGCCASCGKPATEDHPLHNSHAETRKRGSVGADWRRIFRQCWKCHEAYEGKAERFLADRGFTLEDRERWIQALQMEALERGIIKSGDINRE